MQASAAFKTLFMSLYMAFGAQHWWPGQTRFEIIVGAILTQNTNWGNVEKAIRQLKQGKCLTPKAMRAVTFPRLTSMIKSAGYFNVKAKRLKNFTSFLYKEYGGSLSRMAQQDGRVLRVQLLSVNGIGPETADSILLYAFNYPIFVVDAYTKRILYRHNLASYTDDYHTLQEYFHTTLPRHTQTFNEYHALIVRVGKDFCKPTPRCEECPLKDFHRASRRACPKCHRFLRRGETVSAARGCGQCAKKR